jgi:hypothetical protein
MRYDHRMAAQKLDIVGAIEIVARARDEYGAALNLRTVRAWETRRAAWDAEGRPARSQKRPHEEPMPDPAGQVNGSPAWHWSEVAPWLERTGRVPVRPHG